MSIVIIEDHFMFREVLTELVQGRLGMEVLASVETGEEGLIACKDAELDLVLLDLDLPDMDGFSVAEKIMRWHPGLRILAVSSLSDEYTLFRVLRSGLFGFVDKTTQSLEELEHAIREVLDWRPFYAASVHQVNLSQMGDPNAFSKVLTPREQEILCSIGVGLRNEQVAEQFNVSPGTVQSHRRNIMTKLSISSTPDLIRYALKKGFTRVSKI